MFWLFVGFFVIILLIFAFIRVGASKSVPCPNCGKKIKMVTNSVRCPFCKVKFVKDNHNEYKAKS